MNSLMRVWIGTHEARMQIHVSVVVRTRLPFTTPDYLNDTRFTHDPALDATFRDEGVAAVQTHHPDVAIYTPVIDRELNAHKFIVPGLGDFGDRLYGTT